jgi:hypothetical protein
MGTIHLLLGRHGPNDHYLGGRFRRPDRACSPRTLAFALSERTVHLFELIAPCQLREPVAARRMLPSYSTRYELTALAFAQKVESAGGGNYNAESRPSAGSDREYAELSDAAHRADLAFFRKPTYAGYLTLIEIEERFSFQRDDLIEANLEHFASRGHDVVARLGRVHSPVRRIARRGFTVQTQIGSGSFFPEQILKRRARLGLPVSEEDRMRGYADRLLRIVPIWEAGLKMPPHRFILSLAGEELAAVCERFEQAVFASGSLPAMRSLLAILEEVCGYRPEEGHALEDPRFTRLRGSRAAATESRIPLR